jgi:hypothetical protein
MSLQNHTSELNPQTHKIIETPFTLKWGSNPPINKYFTIKI